MQAAIQNTFGAPEVLTVAAVEAPALGAKQVRVAVHASPVTKGGLRMRASDFPGVGGVVAKLMFGIRRPKHRTGGMSFAGRVIEVGAAVERFAVGDDVFGAAEHGAWAEELVIDAEGPLTRMPAGVTWAEAAAMPYGALTAWTLLDGRVQAGETVAIVGAAGGVGRYAVQVAKHLGATVVAVCRGADAERVRALGADRVVDYRSADFAAEAAQYDVVFDTSDSATFAGVRRALKPGGRFVTIQLSMKTLLQMLWTRVAGDKRVVFGMALPTRESIEQMGALLERGAVRAVIGERFPLEQIVAAHRCAEARPQGDVIVEVRPAARLRRVA